MELTRPNEGDLYTFAIYGRDFFKDGQKASAATTVQLSSILGISLIAVIGLWCV